MLKYPLDLTGELASNRIVNEMHVIGKFNHRLFTPDHQAFFTKNLILRTTKNAQPLTRGKEYEFLSPNAECIRGTNGLEVYNVIQILDPTVHYEILIDYNIPGGVYNSNAKQVNAAVDDLLIGDGTINYSDIKNIPELFTPSRHLTDVSTIFGYEYLITALTDLNSVIQRAGNVIHTEFLKDFNLKFIEFRDLLAAHRADVNNPHQNTADQLGGYTYIECDGFLDVERSKLAGLNTKITDLSSKRVILLDILTSLDAALNAALISIPDALILDSTVQAVDIAGANAIEADSITTAAYNGILGAQTKTKAVETRINNLILPKEAALNIRIPKIPTAQSGNESEVDIMTDELMARIDRNIALIETISTATTSLYQSTYAVAVSDYEALLYRIQTVLIPLFNTINYQYNSQALPGLYSDAAQFKLLQARYDQLATGGGPAISRLTIPARTPSFPTVPGTTYVATIYGYTDTAGTGGSTLGPNGIKSGSSGAFLATDPNTWINWPDGNMIISRTYKFTADSTSAVAVINNGAGQIYKVSAFTID